MRFELRDPTSSVVWEDGDLFGSGPAYQGSVNAFVLSDPFMLTPTGPEITPDIEDPLSAYLTIRYYGFLDDEPEHVDVPQNLLYDVEDLIDVPPDVKA